MKKNTPHYGKVKPINYRYIYEEKFYDVLGQLKLPLMIVIFVSTLGVLIFMIANNKTDGESVLNYFFHTVITISTIGYTEGYNSENTALNRFISAVYILFAFPAGYMYGLVKTIQVLTSSNLEEIYRYWRMYKNMESLKDHFIITPFNEITKEIMKDFKKRNIPFILIEPNKGKKKEVEEFNPPYFIFDEPHKRAVLLGSFIDKAKGLITAFEENTQDLAVIVTARLIKPDKESFFIFATATTEGSAEKMKLLGANEVIVPQQTIGKRIVSLVLHPPSPLVSNFLNKIAFGERMDIDITEVYIDENSWIVGKALKDIHLRKNTKTTVVAIVKPDGKMDISPSGESVIKSGYTLLLLGKPEHIEKAKMYLTKPQEVSS
jgi:voltage-gated potassium channel